MVNDDLFIQEENYLIHKYSINNILYYLCIPSDKFDNYQMFVSFPTKNINNLNEEEISNLVKDINLKVTSVNKNGILVFPCIDYSLLEEAAYENDHRLYIKLFNKIREITNDAYLKINKDNYNLNYQHQIRCLIFANFLKDCEVL